MQLDASLKQVKEIVQLHDQDQRMKFAREVVEYRHTYDYEREAALWEMHYRNIVSKQMGQANAAFERDHNQTKEIANHQVHKLQDKLIETLRKA